MTDASAPGALMHRRRCRTPAGRCRSCRPCPVACAHSAAWLPLAGEALHHHLRVLVDQNAHGIVFPYGPRPAIVLIAGRRPGPALRQRWIRQAALTASTTFLALLLMVVCDRGRRCRCRAAAACLLRWCLPGARPPGTFARRCAATTPSAIMSQRMMPPKMFTKMPSTSSVIHESEPRSRAACRRRRPRPGSSPAHRRWATTSMVAMARRRRR